MVVMLFQKSVLRDWHKTFIVSLGVGCDIAFEKDLIFLNQKNKAVLYDKTMTSGGILFWTFRLFPNIKKILGLIVKYFVMKLQIYMHKDKLRLVPKYVGANQANKDIISLDQIIADTSNEVEKADVSILKIDIERSEYEIFNEFNFEQLSEFSIILIEYHGLIKHLDNIKEINSNFEKQGYFVGHFHNNNCTPYLEKFSCNNCIEITYLKSNHYTRAKVNSNTYPIDGLDFSCCPKNEEKSIDL